MSVWGGHGLQTTNELVRRNWWTFPTGEVNKGAIEYVMAVDRLQAPLYDKFVKLEALYDTNPRTNLWNNKTPGETLGVVTENVVASIIDTVASAVAATDVRARFETTDADWDQQRQAKHLEWYCDGLAVLFDVGKKCRYGFKAAALKGTALNKVYIDEFDQIRVDQVMVDDIVIDEIETRNGMPRQMHYRTLLDREDMKAQFPDHAEEIDNAQMQPGRNWRLWAGYRPVKQNEVVVVESWRLPVGVKGRKGYIPGRHTITIDGCDLLDEQWHKPFFPFAQMVWTQPSRGWYGIGLAERIAGIQRALNKRNWQIERTLDQTASPTMFVHQADAKLAVTAVNRIGNIAVYHSAVPSTPTFPAVHPETYQDRERMKAAAFEESGQSRLAAQSVKPPGVDSAVALREYRDQTTQRFALQEKGFEQLWLDTMVLILDCCKDLGDQAPVVMKKTKFGSRKIKWSDVDMQDIRGMIQAASTLPLTPSGRSQTVVEWAQAGLVTTDEARELTDHPDLERAMSINTASLEDIERTIQAIEDGEVCMPEPYQNLKLGVWRMQAEYLRIRDLDAPEEILENLRQWIVQAGAILNPTPLPGPMNAGLPANGNVAPGAANQNMGPPTPNQGGPMPMTDMPQGAPPQAAFAAPAMQLVAGAP